jgi:thiamine biosynthesis lipoprotein
MTVTRRRLLTLTAGAVLTSALPALGADAIRLSGRAFGTSWQARLRGGGALEPLTADIAGLLARIDRSMSPFRPDSEIVAFNQAEAGWHAVSPDFAQVTAEALQVAALTDGAFEPSVGPDVGRYGFGPIRGERAGRFSDFAIAGGAIHKAEARQSLDLCGIAKGYALDLMAERVAAAGFDDFVVELGGEVLARGSDSGGRAWRIGIADPLADRLYAVLDTGGLAIATSGDAVNAYTVGGRRYSHIIDPATDEPLVNGVASVSVLAETAMTADAMATALMVMGAGRGAAFAEARGIPALFLIRAPGGLSETATSAYIPHRMF